MLLIPTARAEENGPSLFGLEGFNKATCDNVVRMFNGVKHPSFPFLWDSFRKNRALCRKRLMRLCTNRGCVVYVHFANFPGLRNRRLSKHELFYGHTVESLNHAIEGGDSRTLYHIAAQAFDIREFALKQHRRAKVVLVLGPEHNLTNRAYRVTMWLLRQIWPFEIITNPLKEKHAAHYLLADGAERHGMHVACDSTSIAHNDGTDIPVSGWGAFFKEHRKCRARFLWVPAWQGIELQFRNVRDRNFRITRADSSLVNRILRRLQNER